MFNTEPCPLRTQFGFGEPLGMGLTDDLRRPADERKRKERVQCKYQKHVFVQCVYSSVIINLFCSDVTIKSETPQEPNWKKKIVT